MERKKYKESYGTISSGTGLMILLCSSDGTGSVGISVPSTVGIKDRMPSMRCARLASIHANVLPAALDHARTTAALGAARRQPRSHASPPATVQLSAASPQNAMPNAFASAGVW